MWVLIDSGSDGNLIFASKDKPMLLPYLKRLVPQLWNILNGIFQTKHKARVELNFFEYSDSKRYYHKKKCLAFSLDLPRGSSSRQLLSMAQLGLGKPKSPLKKVLNFSRKSLVSSKLKDSPCSACIRFR